MLSDEGQRTCLVLLCVCMIWLHLVFKTPVLYHQELWFYFRTTTVHLLNVRDETSAVDNSELCDPSDIFCPDSSCHPVTSSTWFSVCMSCIGWDRVNFLCRGLYGMLSCCPISKELGVHKKLGGGRTRRADLNWPKGYSIPCEIIRKKLLIE